MSATADIPRISVIVIVHNMARQAMNTLYSLSAKYQQNVQESDYEIIVVENESANLLDEQQVASLGDNIRYIRRQESGASPAAAINEAFRHVRADYIGLLIDGARMVTPRVIEYALMARAISLHSLTAVPSFNLGHSLHYQHIDNGYGEEEEQQLLDRIDWKTHGYRLFDISNVGEANPKGIFLPFMENNCYFSSLENFRKIGFADESFDLPGGGSLNLHMFRATGTLPRCNRYIIMAGEGNFHQFHGGVTTRQIENRDAMIQRFRQQLEAHWGGEFCALHREPILLGAVNSHAQPFLRYSSRRGQKRYRLLELTTATYDFCKDDHPAHGYVYPGDQTYPTTTTDHIAP